MCSPFPRHFVKLARRLLCFSRRLGLYLSLAHPRPKAPQISPLHCPYSTANHFLAMDPNESTGVMMGCVNVCMEDGWMRQQHNTDEQSNTHARCDRDRPDQTRPDPTPNRRTNPRTSTPIDQDIHIHTPHTTHPKITSVLKPPQRTRSPRKNADVYVTSSTSPCTVHMLHL